jgi:hypothetical protein
MRMGNKLSAPPSQLTSPLVYSGARFQEDPEIARKNLVRGCFRTGGGTLVPRK